MPTESQLHLEFPQLDHLPYRSPFAEACVSLGVAEGPNWIDRFGDALTAWARKQIPPDGIRTLSLFAGAGGLDLGFHDIGFKIDIAVELDRRFADTLRANSVAGARLSGTRVVETDIAHFAGTELPRIQFLLGGPPCQPFSAAGRRAHGVPGTDDPRGTLFAHYIRILKSLRPNAFLFENVYGLTGAQGGSAWTEIARHFQEAGYAIAYRILDAADYGVPQHRERLFIVGTLDQRPFHFPRPTHGPDSPDGRPHVSAGEAIADLSGVAVPGPSSVGGRYGHLLAEIPPGLNYSYFTERMGHPTPLFAWRSKFSDFLYKADPSRPVRTIKAQGGQYTGPFHWASRPFSVAELKRLQTIPDEYRIQGNRQAAIQQIGNSVPPQLARILAIAILQQIFGIEAPFKLPLLEPSERLSFRKLKRLRTASYQASAAAMLGPSRSSPASPATPGESLRGQRRYRAILRSDFALVPEKTGPLAISETLSARSWRFAVRGGAGCRTEAFTIEIKPAAGSPWRLPTKAVMLSAERLQPAFFTAVWKAFELCLAREGVKADLVQLSGYYQYPPAIRSRMEFRPGVRATSPWRSVRAVVNGASVAATVSAETLAFGWGCQPRAVVAHCRLLRRLGYEVRNHNTNPQIRDGSYLIPYAFPTLNPMSVQLRKKL